MHGEEYCLSSVVTAPSCQPLRSPYSYLVIRYQPTEVFVSIERSFMYMPIICAINVLFHKYSISPQMPMQVVSELLSGPFAYVAHAAGIIQPAL